jgi:hypothetical protein
MSAQIKNTPDYATPQAVLAAIELMQAPERVRAGNRAKIDHLAQGQLPMTPEQQRENQSSVNVNWGELGKVLREATGQVNKSLLHKGNYATYKLVKGKPEKRDEWSAIVTEAVNQIKTRGKTGMENFFRLKNRNGSLVLHGIGVLLWPNDYDVFPRFVPLEDLLVPTGSLQGFANWTNFATNLYLTPSELIEMTHNNSKEAEQAGWNLAAVRKVLDVYGKLNANPNNWHWWDQPEKMVVHWRENQGAYDCDSVPKVNLSCLYYKSQDSKWYRKIVLKDVEAGEGVTGLKLADEFIFDSGRRVFAEDITHILHIQYGDCNPVPPYTYHGTRGMGELLFAPVQYLNLLRSQWFHHVMERLMMGLQIDNPTDRDRPKLFNLKPYFVLEQGVRIIPENERHQVDPRLVEGAMSESRQLLSESSANYVQDIDTGTNREQTLGEAQIKLQNANRIVSVMMDTLYKLESYREEEEFRRLMLPNSSDPAAKKFQAEWKKAAIPEDLMKPECWQVDVERVAGDGDQTIALQQAMTMIQMLPHYDPTAQRTIIRDSTAVILNDYDKARRLVPEEKPEVTKGAMAADECFPNLMLGTPVGIRQGIERRDYIESMLGKMQAVVQRIQQTDNMGTTQDVIGLGMVSENIKENIQILEQNPAEKQFATAAMKAVGVMDNEVKGFAQRLAEKSQEGQQDPAELAKLELAQMAAQQKAQINQEAHEQRMAQKEATFTQKLQQSMESHALEMQRMLQEAQAELTALRLKTSSEVSAIDTRAEAEVAATAAKTNADVSATKKRTAAQPATAATE